MTLESYFPLLMYAASLLAFAGMANAIQDRLASADNFISSWLYRFRSPWFDHRLATAGRKWKNGDRSQGEKFLGSSTAFVFVTDGWHFFKELKLMAIWSAMAFLSWPIYPLFSIHPFLGFFLAILLLKIVYGIPFTFLHDKLLNKNSMLKDIFNALWERSFTRALMIMLPSFFGYIFLGEMLNRLDPNFSPDSDATFLGDWIMAVLFIIGWLYYVYLAVIEYRKKKASHGTRY